VVRNEFTAIVEPDDPWYVAYCAEVPAEESLASLREAIALILEHRREESLRALPPDARQEFVVAGRSAAPPLSSAPLRCLVTLKSPIPAR